MYSSSFRLTNRDIDLAFEARHLFLVCQPKIALATGEGLGAEAYIRWNHPDYGLLPPGLFLSFFERRERSGELTRYVASAAADVLAEWTAAADAEKSAWPISINLGAADLADKRLPGDLDGILGERGLDPSRLILEVPEGAFVRHGEVAAQIIGELRRLGFSTALDGGGAVIVPAELLRRDCFGEVKIGGAAIIQFASRLRHAGLGFVGRRVALAASRGLEQRRRRRGCNDACGPPGLGFTAAQGAHICRPLAPADLAGWTAPPRNVDVEIDVAPETSIELADDAENDVLLLTDPVEEDATGEMPLPQAAPPREEPVVCLSWEDVDFHVPGEEVRGVAWRLDRVCLSPDRWLVALIRKPRRLAHMRKPEPAKKSPPLRAERQAKPAPRPRHIRRPRAPSALVTRPSLVQLALGF